MHSDDLTAAQKARLRRQIERQVRYICKLCDRMAALHFPDSDPVAFAAARARLTLTDLYKAVRRAGSRRK